MTTSGLKQADSPPPPRYECSESSSGDPLFKCLIEGRPFVKKNTQKVVRKHGHVRVIYSPKFLEWELTAILIMRQANTGRPPVSDPITARFRFFFQNRQAEADLSNLIEGPQDALKKAGVITDDRIIQVIHATKHFGETSRTEIELYALPEEVE